MKKYYISFAFAYLFVSCNKNEITKQQSTTHKQDTSITPLKKDIDTLKISKNEKVFNDKLVVEKNEYENGGSWLKKSIENYFSQPIWPEMETITTKRYAEFKSDAMGIQYDGGLTDKQFAEKWDKKYNLKLTNNESFLIGMQDNETIKVTTINQTKITKNGAWYHVIIRDTYFKININRDIRIIKNGNSFLIDEVLE